MANHIVELHDCFHVKRLRVFFNPRLIYAIDLWNWIKLAFEKDVKELDLNFHMILKDLYVIPAYIL